MECIQERPNCKYIRKKLGLTATMQYAHFF